MTRVSRFRQTTRQVAVVTVYSSFGGYVEDPVRGLRAKNSKGDRISMFCRRCELASFLRICGEVASTSVTSVPVSIVAARIFCCVVMHSIEINAAGFSIAGQSVQFRARAKLAIT